MREQPPIVKTMTASNAVDFSGYESWLFDEDGQVSESLGNFDAEEYQRQLESGVADE